MGGKAFSDVQPVEQTRARRIYDYYVERMSLDQGDHEPLGSTLKKPLSGDVDIAVSETKYDYPRLVANLTSWLGAQNINTHGRNFNQIYTRYDIDGGPPVQVDLMIGYVPYLSFSHWSPIPGTSDYNGTIRTEYLKAIIKVASPHVGYGDHRCVARVGYTMHHHLGVEFGARWCPPRKDGKGFTQKMVAVKTEDWDGLLEVFPEMEQWRYSGCILKDPDYICCYLLGQHVTPRTVNSYEQLAILVDINPALKQQADLIWKLFTERLDEIKQPHPERFI